MTDAEINAAWESYLESLEAEYPGFVANMRAERCAKFAFDAGYCRGFSAGFDKAHAIATNYLPPSKGIEC